MILKINSNYPFAFSAKDLSKLFTPEPKYFPLLKKYGGIEGLSKGLHTSLQTGLSQDETLKPISLKEITGEDFASENEQENVHPVLLLIQYQILQMRYLNSRIQEIIL